MNSYREDFYQITKKDNYFEVSKSFLSSSYPSNNVLIRIECEDLIQFDSVLIAQQIDGSYNIYLPSIKGYEYTCGLPDIDIIDFVLVYESVSEFHYYEDPTCSAFNHSLLVLKIKTDETCGYWTGIIPYYFEWYLTKERLKERKNNLYKIPYSGISEFRYYNHFILSIDGISYFINTYNIDEKSNKTGLIFQKLGKGSIDLLPGNWYFKLSTKEEGDSIYTLFGCKYIDSNRTPSGAQVCFGPFNSIIKTEIEFSDFKLPPCFLGKNNDGSIGGFFICLLNDYNLEKASKYAYFVTFNSPIEEIKFVELFTHEITYGCGTKKSIIGSWKLSCKTGNKIMFCPITCDTECSITKVLDVSKYL